MEKKKKRHETMQLLLIIHRFRCCLNIDKMTHSLIVQFKRELKLLAKRHGTFRPLIVQMIVNAFLLTLNSSTEIGLFTCWKLCICVFALFGPLSLTNSNQKCRPLKVLGELIQRAPSHCKAVSPEGAGRLSKFRRVFSGITQLAVHLPQLPGSRLWRGTYWLTCCS